MTVYLVALCSNGATSPLLEAVGVYSTAAKAEAAANAERQRQPGVPVEVQPMEVDKP